jgi:hypothetical protein
VKVLCAVLLLATAADARAFVRETVPNGGPCLFWARRQVDFTVSELGSQSAPGCTVDQSLDAVRRGFAAWRGVSCSDVEPMDRGTTSRTDTGYDRSGANNLNLIVWRPRWCDDVVPPDDGCHALRTCANIFDCWDHASAAVIAVTTTTFNRATGEIVDADMELNDWNLDVANPTGFYFTCVDPGTGVDVCGTYGDPGCIDIDAQNTVTHEEGHVFGLDHTPDPNAVMYASTERGETKKRYLKEDDIKGLCTIYPKAKPTSTCVDAVQLKGIGFDTSCGCGGGAAGFAFLGLLLSRRRYRTRMPA